MADIDIEHFREHDKMNEHPNKGENISLNPEGVGEGSTWESGCKQETLFGWKAKKKGSPILT